MQNFQNELQTLGLDQYQTGEVIPMDPQSLQMLGDPRHWGRCGGRCGFGCGGFRCGGFRCGGFRCGGFRCGGCFGCGGCGFGCGGFGFGCGGFGFGACVGACVGAGVIII